MQQHASPWSLAIDFGTSNTAAAYMSRGQVHPIRLESDSNLMPSCVLAVDGEIRVGRSALNQARLHPERFESSPKRRLDEREVRLGDLSGPPEELVAAVLARVRQRADAVAGPGAPSRVWLTHPENWPPEYIGLLRRAAERAGFGRSVIRTVSEPVAAAQHYAATTGVTPGSHLVVFDVGGGTCDAAVLRAGTGGTGFEVLGAEGDPFVGGNDFDDCVNEWVYDQLEARGDDAVVEQLDGTKPSALRARLALRDSIRSAKEDLSLHASAVVSHFAGDDSVTLSLTRDEYDELVDDEIRRAVQLAERVLGHTIGVGNVDALYLTGGASVTPVLVRRLRELTGQIPATLDDPKLVVAQGALRTPEPGDDADGAGAGAAGVDAANGGAGAASIGAAAGAGAAVGAGDGPVQYADAGGRVNAAPQRTPGPEYGAQPASSVSSAPPAQAGQAGPADTPLHVEQPWSGRPSEPAVHDPDATSAAPFDQLVHAGNGGPGAQSSPWGNAAAPADPWANNAPVAGQPRADVPPYGGGQPHPNAPHPESTWASPLAIFGAVASLLALGAAIFAVLTPVRFVAFIAFGVAALLAVIGFWLVAVRLSSTKQRRGPGYGALSVVRTVIAVLGVLAVVGTVVMALNLSI